MKVFIIFTLYILLALSLAYCAEEPVQVGGDMGKSWLQIIKSQKEEVSAQQEEVEDKSGLWSWGGAPVGHKVVDGSLEPDLNGSTRMTSEWLWSGSGGEPLTVSLNDIYLNYGLAPYYSDDPWILAQQLERPIRTSYDEAKDFI